MASIIFIISMFHLLWVLNLIKVGANFSVGTKFIQIYNFGSRSSVPSTIFIIRMFDLHKVSNFEKRWNTLQFWDQICPISGQDPQFSNIIVTINKLDLLWVSNFIALGIYFILGTKFSWNEEIDTCFNVECVLLGRNFDFLMVTWWLLLFTASYRLLLLVTTFSMNVRSYC